MNGGNNKPLHQQQHPRIGTRSEMTIGDMSVNSRNIPGIFQKSHNSYLSYDKILQIQKQGVRKAELYSKYSEKSVPAANNDTIKLLVEH